MKTSYILILSLLFLLALNVINVRIVGNLKKINAQLYKQQIDYKDKIKELKHIDSLINESNLTTIDPNLRLLSITGDTISINKLSQEKKIIIRFNEVACASCIDDIMQTLQKLGLPPDKVSIISDFRNLKDIFLFNKKYNLNHSTYSLIDSDLKIAMESEFYIPFAFMLDEELLIKEVVPYIKNNPYALKIKLKKFAEYVKHF